MMKSVIEHTLEELTKPERKKSRISRIIDNIKCKLTCCCNSKCSYNDPNSTPPELTDEINSNDNKKNLIL